MGSPVGEPLQLAVEVGQHAVHLGRVDRPLGELRAVDERLVVRELLQVAGPWPRLRDGMTPNALAKAICCSAVVIASTNLMAWSLYLLLAEMPQHWVNESVPLPGRAGRQSGHRVLDVREVVLHARP